MTAPRALQHHVDEKTFQAQVIELANVCGWRHLHVRRSIGKGRKWVTSTNLAGWPDLMLMRPPDGLIFAELKSDTGKATPEQVELLEFLGRYPYATAVVWSPKDWPTIEQALTRKARP